MGPIQQILRQLQDCEKISKEHLERIRETLSNAESLEVLRSISLAGASSVGFIASTYLAVNSLVSREPNQGTTVAATAGAVGFAKLLIGSISQILFSDSSSLRLVITAHNVALCIQSLLNANSTKTVFDTNDLSLIRACLTTNQHKDAV